MRKVAFITGAARNTGYAIARRFAADGYDVCLTSRDLQSAKEAEARIAQEFPEAKILGLAMEQADVGQIDAVFARIQETFGRLDAYAANAALHSAGYPQHPVASYRQFVGNGLRMLVRRALPEGEADRIGPTGFEALVERTGANYARDWAVKTRPYPHVPELLQELHRRGIPLAVVTNKPHECTLHMLKHYFPESPFLFIQGAMPNLPHKPDPTGALNAARHLDSIPNETVFVGDSNVDMLTAHNAGMTAVGVDWGFRGAQELKESGADKILYDPLELLPFFEKYAS